MRLNFDLYKLDIFIVCTFTHIEIMSTLMMIPPTADGVDHYSNGIAEVATDSADFHVSNGSKVIEDCSNFIIRPPVNFSSGQDRHSAPPSTNKMDSSQTSLTNGLCVDNNINPNGK